MYMSTMLKMEELDDEIIQKMKDEPAFFVEKMIGMPLHWYQQLVINDPYPYKAMCWSRQIGKSTMVACYVVWYIFAHPNKKILILSQDRDASRRFYDMVLDMILSNPILEASIIGEPLQSKTKFKNKTIMFNKAPGRTGKSVRGDSIDLLIIDEADFIAEEVFVAAEQTTASTGGAIILISTPNTLGSTFHQYFQDGMIARAKKSGKMEFSGEETQEELDNIENEVGEKFVFRAYHFDYKVGLAVNKPDGKPQLSKVIVERMKKKRTYWQFQQEYEAIWAETIASYFTKTAVMGIIDDKYDMEEFGHPHKVYYVGIDFAKHVDSTVMLIAEKLEDGRLKVVHIYTAHGRNWDLQIKDILRITTRFNIIRAFLDGTGVGDGMFDLINAPDSPLYMKCERVVMGGIAKAGLYQNLTQKMQEQRVIIPHHKQFVDEMLYLQYEATPGSEYVKIRSPPGMPTLHDDFPDALALLVKAIKGEIYQQFKGAKVGQGRFDSAYGNFWDQYTNKGSGQAFTENSLLQGNPFAINKGGNKKKKKKEPFRNGSAYGQRF